MIIPVHDLDPDIISEMDIQSRGTRKRSSYDYVKDPITFDIETTPIDQIEQSVMYIWQCQITEQITIIGRSWSEFRELYDLVNDCLPSNAMIVCYVHNLSYEFQFLKSVIPISDMFAMDLRKVLKFTSGHWEFRCSYLHSNMSLEKFLQAMNVKHKKLTMDYAVKRYPWTDLDDNDLQYCIHDVQGLREAILYEMEKDGDDLYTIPLTSTGYVRREAKEALKGYQRFIRPALPDVEIFDMLRAAFRGGNTHANRYNSNRIIKASPDFPIIGMDESSAYAALLLTEKFPMGFIRTDPKFLRLYIQHGKACLMEIDMFDIRLKQENWGCPYISISKCIQVDNPVNDNGRLLSADAVRMVITEIDLSIIFEEYEFTFQINKLYTASKRRLPERFRKMILSMYKQKTMLKGTGDDYTYTKVKNKFNSIYGMCVQNPCKADIIYKDGILIPDVTRSENDLIDQYRKHGWLPYQWGVWCTAYARRKLEDGLRIIPPDAFLYADTDSIKFVGSYEKEFIKLNKSYMHEDLSAHDSRGQIHYIGIFERESDAVIDAFITMGAKKYCYHDTAGLHLTVSGVNKKDGPEELGSIENFKEGFVFRKAGGMEAIYNDFPDVHHYKIDGHDLDIISNVYLRDSTYTLTLTYEYRRLINYLMNADIKRELYYDYSVDEIPDHQHMHSIEQKEDI